jgi:hypothetical protein
MSLKRAKLLCKHTNRSLQWSKQFLYDLGGFSSYLAWYLNRSTEYTDSKLAKAVLAVRDEPDTIPLTQEEVDAMIHAGPVEPTFTPQETMTEEELSKLFDGP